MSKKTKEEFLSEFKKVNGDKYDYSLFMDDKIVLESVKQKISIICPVHGELNTTINGHSSGKGCPKCAGTQKKTKEEFVSDFRKVHGDKYDYSNMMKS
jgi:hypothetical protein